MTSLLESPVSDATIAPTEAPSVESFALEEGLNELLPLSGRGGRTTLHYEAWESYVRFRNNGFRQPEIFHGAKAMAECRKGGPNKLLDMTDASDRPEREHYIDGPIGESAYREDLELWRTENVAAVETTASERRIEAKKVCGACPFRQDCLARAVTVPVDDHRSGKRNARVVSHETSMMWGGRDPEEIRKVFKYMLRFWEYEVDAGTVVWDHAAREFVVVGAYQG